MADPVATPEGGATEQETRQRIENFLLAEEAPESEEKPPQGGGEAGEEPESQEDRRRDEEEPDDQEDQDESDEDEPEGDEEEDDSEEAEADESDEETLGVEELAHYLGIDESQLEVDESGDLFIKTKVDGEPGRAKLNDLVKSYQLEGHLNKRNMEVAELQKSLEEKDQQRQQEVSQKIQQAEDSVQIAWATLAHEYQSVNWQELKQEDPQQYTILRQDFEDRKGQLQRAYQNVQQHRQEEQSKQLEAHQENLRKQAERLPELIPEWSDEKLADSEKPKIRQYAQSIGYSEDEVQSIADARAVAVLRKAMLYDKLKSSKPSVSKKLRAAPQKVSKPGSPKSQGEKQGQRLKRLRSNVKKSGGSGSSVRSFLLESGIV